MNRRDFVKMCAAGASAHAFPFVLTGETRIARKIEVIASSLDDAKAAHAGGASRVELAVDLQKGGLTPPMNLIREVADQVPIPMRVMVRLSPGFGLGSSAELERLMRQAREIARLGIDGIVIGYVQNGRIDMDSIGRIIAAAPDASYTIHNAVEATDNPLDTIRELRTLSQIDVLLVHGRGTTLDEKIQTLNEYRQLWEDQRRRLLVNGLHIDEIQEVCEQAGISQFHLSQQVRTPPQPYPTGHIDPTKLRSAVRLLKEA